MEEIGLKEGIALVKKYNKMLPKEREMLQKQRFFAALFHAREHSPLYNELYKNLGVNFFMRDVPMLDRDYALSHKELWQCDETVPMEIAAAINTVRTFSFEKDYYSFLLRGSKTVIITSYTEEVSPYTASWDKSTTYLSVFLPTEELVSKLNELKPALLWGYPSTLEKLLYEKQNNRLRIKPVLIMSGGENLPEELRAKLIDEFNCTVQKTYASRELGVIASECSCGSLHVNDDWVLLEPVDSNNKPVPYGQPFDKVLATNMYKTLYPVIRMNLPDKIKFIKAPCPCGNPSPHIEVLAGKHDSLCLPSAEGETEFNSDSFNDVFKEISGILSYQLVFYGTCNISVRLEVSDDSMKSFLFLQAEQALRKFLRQKGVTAMAITLDEMNPLLDEATGKFNNVIDNRE